MARFIMNVEVNVLDKTKIGDFCSPYQVKYVVEDSETDTIYCSSYSNICKGEPCSILRFCSFPMRVMCDTDDELYDKYKSLCSTHSDVPATKDAFFNKGEEK